MHGHMPPQQHPGMHPAHQPPHLAHMTNLPPHSMQQRDHHANRLNANARHHHPPRGVVDHPNAGGMAPPPHLPMQVPPPSHQPPPPQNGRKSPPPPYTTYYAIHKPPLPLTSAHLHASPPGLVPPPSAPPGTMPMPAGPGGKQLPYGGGGNGGTGMGGQQPGGSLQQHHPVTMAAPPPPIPVVSAATPAGTKTRHIPSSTDHKVHHHGHNVLQANGNGGPGLKAIAVHQQPNQHGSVMDKSKMSGVGVNRHHHNHHHSQQQQQQQHQQHQQQQQQQKQQQQQLISTIPNDVILSKDASAMISASTGPTSTPTIPTQTTEMSNVTTTVTPSVGGTESNAAAAGVTLASSDSLEALANIKEKTTMCLVNELARYNKIQHQYRLTGESGPAHKKHFTVTLKLGDEEYAAEGASIKKAQHKAAGDAIAATKYKHPPARTNRRTKTGAKGNVSSFTPTVELNALAMKRGEPTVYQVKAVPVPVPKYGGPPVASGTNGMAPTPTTIGGGGRRPAVDDKAAPSVGGHPPPPGIGYGGTGGTPGGPGGGYWGRTGIAAGVGGRGAMGGFHPGHQQQQQQQQQQHHPHHGHQRDDRNHTPHHYHHHDGGYSHSAAVPSVQEFYKATLRVGERTFLGEGHTPQAARHDAAARALEVLKPLTATENADSKGRSGDPMANGDDESGDGTTTTQDGCDPNAELKSPISLVHEIAVQRSLSVVFEVISEKGPPHMTVFVTQCKVGTIVTEGEGTGKKLSKKRAAEKMLEELRKLQEAEQQSYANGPWAGGEGGPVASHGSAEKRKANAKASSSGSTVDGSGTAKKKPRNLIKEKSVTDVAEKENPISRLMQIQQARKEKQPVYTLLENDRPNVGRRRQFTIEVSAAGRQATGVGMTKKAAKWSAAEALLVEMGYATTDAKGPGDSVANKENQSGAANDLSPSGTKRSRKVRFQEQTQANGGITAATTTTTSATATATSVCGVSNGKADTSGDSMNDSITSNDSMVTNSSGVSSESSSAPKPEIGAKKEQLLYLAQLLKFEVQFSDFPKGNHGEYLTLVKLSTEPPQLCHGIGASQQVSHDDAARSALDILSKIGLDNVRPKAASSVPQEDAVSSPVKTTQLAVSTGVANGK